MTLNNLSETLWEANPFADPLRYNEAGQILPQHCDFVTHPLPKTSRVFVSGHRGLVGSALVRRLQLAGFENLLVATRQELDLRDQATVSKWFAAHRPESVLHVAGTVGGIHANATRPADFLYDNLLIHATVLRA